MQLTTSGHLEGLCGIGFLYTQGNIGIQLTEQPITEMTACNIFPLLTGKRRIIDNEMHGNGRL